MNWHVLAPLAVAVVVAGGVCAAWWIDRYGSGSVVRVAACTAWGVVCGAVMTPFARQLAPLTAPVAMAAVAAAAVTLLIVAVPLAGLALGWLASPLDGVLVGLAVGSTAGLVRVWLGAAVGGWEMAALVGLQALAAGVAAGGLVAASLAPKAIGRVVGAVVTLVLGIAIETCGASSLAAAAGGESDWERSAPAVVLLLVLGGVAAALWAAARLESAVLRGELAEEIRFGVLPPWVAEVVPSLRRRMHAAWWPRADERRDLLRQLVRLAYRKRGLRSLNVERSRVGGLEVGRTRQRLRTLLAVEAGEDEE